MGRGEGAFLFLLGSWTTLLVKEIRDREAMTHLGLG